VTLYILAGINFFHVLIIREKWKNAFRLRVSDHSLRKTIRKGEYSKFVYVNAIEKKYCFLRKNRIIKVLALFCVQCAWSSHSGDWFLWCSLGEKPRENKGRE